MAKQDIKDIALKDLHLWTENPRDPIGTGTNQKVADRAISPDGRSKWNIHKLRASMEKQEQKIYHNNEIPTVARKNGKLVIYDGNRRVLIGMLINGIVRAEGWKNPPNFTFPNKIPCNVCDTKTALAIVDRMHADNGTWKPLERDIFKRNHMEENPSDFLVLENATKIISAHSHLNVGFVKKEILNTTNLHEMGFSTNNGKFKHRYNKDTEAMEVLEKISEAVRDKKITTRKRRGEIINVLKEDVKIKAILSSMESNRKYRLYGGAKATEPRRKPKIKEHKLFGGNLNLQKSEDVLEIFEDIKELYKHFRGKSYYFPWAFIRVGLRLLCESAAKSRRGKMPMDAMVQKHFEGAKNQLSKDEKHTLNDQDISSAQALIKLLQSGAHDYTATNNRHKAVAMSIIVGKIVEIEINKDD